MRTAKELLELAENPVKMQYVCGYCKSSYDTAAQANACRTTPLIDPNTKYLSPNPYHLGEGVVLVKSVSGTCQQNVRYVAQANFREDFGHRHRKNYGRYYTKNLSRNTEGHDQWVPLNRRLVEEGITRLEKRKAEYEAGAVRQARKIKFLQKLLKELT